MKMKGKRRILRVNSNALDLENKRNKEIRKERKVKRLRNRSRKMKRVLRKGQHRVLGGKGGALSIQDQRGRYMNNWEGEE